MKITLFIILSLSVWAQDSGSLIGSITELGTGTKLPGVNIMIKGTYYGAATDLDGHFHIVASRRDLWDPEGSIKVCGGAIIGPLDHNIHAGKFCTRAQFSNTAGE